MCDFCDVEDTSSSRVLNCQVCLRDICDTCSTTVCITKDFDLHVCPDCARLDFLEFAKVAREASKLNEIAQAKYKEAYDMLNVMKTEAWKNRPLRMDLE